MAPSICETCTGWTAGASAGSSTLTSTWKSSPTDSSFTDSFIACQSWKPSR